MKRSFTLHFERFSYFLIPLLSVMLMLIGTGAGAAIYDDFNGPTIDSTKWTITGTGFFQSAGDGFLYFSAAASPPQTVISTSLYTSGVFTMPFSDYVCNNAAPPGQGLGSIAGFGLGTRSSNDWVRFERGQVQGDAAHGITGGYIEVNWVNPNEAGHPIHVNWIQSDLTSGFLQTVYNGTDITFFYRSDAGDPWTQMLKTGPNGQPILSNGQPQPLVLPTDWGTGVPMFIQALTGGNLSVTPPDQYSLSFKVDYVDVSQVPEPAVLPLLAGALAIVLGAGFRRSILRRTSNFFSAKRLRQKIIYVVTVEAPGTVWGSATDMGHYPIQLREPASLADQARGVRSCLFSSTTQPAHRAPARAGPRRTYRYVEGSASPAGNEGRGAKGVSAVIRP